MDELEIDVGEIQTPEELQRLLCERLDFPGFYGMNWDAFWDAITGLVEMPKVLRFRNHKLLESRLPDDYRTLMKCLNGLHKDFPNIECKVVMM